MPLTDREREENGVIAAQEVLLRELHNKLIAEQARVKELIERTERLEAACRYLRETVGERVAEGITELVRGNQIADAVRTVLSVLSESAGGAQ